MIFICMNEHGVQGAGDVPLRVLKMKKSHTLLLQIDTKEDPDIQLKLDADHVCSNRPETILLVASNFAESAVMV